MIKQTILEIYFDIPHKGTILVSTLTLSLAESAHFVSDHNEPREHWGGDKWESRLLMISEQRKWECALLKVAM